MEAWKKVKVEVRNVTLSYGETPVLRDVSLSVEPGEFFALLGPSGSGKSTLLRLIAGFAHAQSGSVWIGGEDVSRVPPWNRDIGMVFQNYALWPHMTVAENVAFGLEERRLPREVIRAKVASALELVGLKDYGARRPSQLSGGQQQRVALARTIAVEPKVLLLDEPLSNLDAKLRIHMRAELLALQRTLGITTIFVTHDQEEALSISDRVAVLDGGVIQQVGTPMELYDTPASRFIANFVGTINLLPASVHNASEGSVRIVSPVFGEVTLPRPDHLPPADTIEVGFRPHAVTLLPADAPRDRDHIWMQGTVHDSEFLGEFIRYRVRCGNVEITVDQPHLGGRLPLAPGSAVSLGIQAHELRLIAR
jgi:iron(III) transport system ATP-binding protein